MFNYRLTFKKQFEMNLRDFDRTIKAMAEESCKVNTVKKELEDSIKLAIEEKNADKTAELQKALDILMDDWKTKQKAYNLRLFGGKNSDGKKVGGFCDALSNDLYKAYTEYITTKNYQVMYKAVQVMLIENTKEGNPRDASVNRMTSELLIVLGGRFNSNRKITEGADFVVAMNKRSFKKVVFGAILDIKKNNFTIKSE